MSATDCCAECETQGCVSRATALAAAAHRATLAAHRAPCHWTLAAHRAPCHWPHSWLTGCHVTGHTRCSQGTMSLDAGCTGWSLQDHMAAWEPGLTTAPSTENRSHCAPTFQKRANFKVCSASNVGHFCTTMKSKNPQLNRCKLGTICIMTDDNLFKREPSRNIPSTCYAPSQGQACVQRQVNLTTGVLLGVREMKLQCI